MHEKHFQDQRSFAETLPCNPILPIRMLTIIEVAEKIGLGRTKIHEMMTSGEFPKSVPIGGGRAMRFIESEVDKWLYEQIQKSRTEPCTKPKVWVKRRAKGDADIPAKGSV